MAFQLIQNWYFNEKKLSPGARSLKVNVSLCLRNVASSQLLCFESNRSYHTSQFYKLLIMHTHEMEKRFFIEQK